MSFNVRKYSSYLVISWTVLIVVSLIWNNYQNSRDTKEKALIEARTIFEHNVAYKKWNVMSGGVYVPVTDKNRPDPYIVAPNRDISSMNGKKLTLITHFAMTKQAYEFLRQQSPLPTLNRTISMKPLNPANAPDEWERKALISFEKGQKEISEITTINGEPYLRVLKPYVTTVDECLQCHGFQGYKIGDVRGGVSIAVPMKPYYEGEARTRGTMALSHLLLWFVGMAGIFVLSRDIQKKQQVIAESEWKFRTLSEFAYDWEYWILEDMSLVFMSPSCERVTGYTKEDFEAKPGLLLDIIHPEDGPECRKHLEDFRAEQHEEIEFRILTKDGKTKWLSHVCAPIYSGKDFLGRRISNRDITDRKIAEMRLGAAIREWQDTFDSIEDSIIIMTPDNTVLKANRATSVMLGIPPEEIVGRKCYTLFHKDGAVPVGCPHVASKGSKRSEQMVYEYGEADKIFEITATPILDKNRNIIGSIHITKDITDRKKLEDQLTQSQKMESLGLLAGGTAHDFNNLLTAIMGYSSLLQQELRGTDEKNMRYLQHVLNAAEKAQTLTSSLLTFSRKQIIKPNMISLNSVIENLSELLKRLISEDIELSIKCSGPEFPVFADAHQIEQVLMNLITNAKDAMPGGGRIFIETVPLVLPSSYTSKYGAAPGKYMMISITDTGMGMDKKDLAMIFEPFFTTKGKDKGTGLGLSIVYGIIKQHDGFINVYSEKGSGTTFKIYIPASEEQGGLQNETAQTIEEVADLTGNEILLIAEDEESVREFLNDILRSYGYKIILATDGEDAVRKYNENRDRVDMVILDVVMPRKNGKDAYNAIKNSDPDIKALFISGYTQDILTSKGIYEDGLEFISKPLEVQGLMIKIREILDKKQV